MTLIFPSLVPVQVDERFRTSIRFIPKNLPFYTGIIKSLISEGTVVDQHKKFNSWSQWELDGRYGKILICNRTPVPKWLRTPTEISSHAPPNRNFFALVHPVFSRSSDDLLIVHVAKTATFNFLRELAAPR